MKRAGLRFYCRHFTLIELLIVIAIIGVLASMLLPSLQKARESARQSSCLGRMRNISLACFSYLPDNNSYYPQVAYTSDLANWWSSPVQNPWGATLVDSGYLSGGKNAYMGSDSVFKCPADSSPVASPSSGKRTYTISYACVYSSAEAKFLSIKETVLKDKTRTVMLGESARNYNNIFGGSALAYQMTNQPASAGDWISYLHNLKANFIFADGHSNAFMEREADSQKYTNIKFQVLP